jgi:2-iminoacetate synthase ThiH
MAGSQHGVMLTPDDLIAAAKRAGRTPAQRDTVYNLLATY